MESRLVKVAGGPRVQDAMLRTAHSHGFPLLMHSTNQGTLFVDCTCDCGRGFGWMAVPVHGLLNLYAELGY